MWPLIREIWPCSRGHITAQMADLPYPVLAPCLVHNWCRIIYCSLSTPPRLCQKCDEMLQQGLSAGSFLLWPDLEGSSLSRYNLKRSTRVPLDSERPKDSCSFHPTALSQIGAKWHGGVATPSPPPRAFYIGWGNNMCWRRCSSSRIKNDIIGFLSSICIW